MAIRTPTTAASSVADAFRPVRADVAFVTGGVTLTFLLATLAARGDTRKIEALVGLIVFAALVSGFVAVPWVMMAVVIPLFVALPSLKFFVSSSLGGIKDVISLAAVSAAVLLALRRRAARRPPRLDRIVLLLFGALLLLYAVNLGGLLNGQSGSHGSPWYQGLRLFLEPLSLLLVGLSLRQPERTLRWAQVAVLASAAGTVFWGLAQQALGVQGLARLGYAYGTQIRTIGAHVRSFGTLDDPFLYASFVLLALATLLLSRRIGRYGWALLAFLALGLFVSYVRTASVEALVVVGLALASRRRSLPALFCILIAFAAAGTTLVLASEKSSVRTVNVNPTTYLTLNGRTKLWRTSIGSAGSWPFGQGVGATGTAAERAQKSLTGKLQIGTHLRGTTVDSGYLSLIADIGFFGLAVFLAFLGRIAVLGRRAVAAGSHSGWIAIAVVTILAIDALSRESFTSYPMPYIGMLLAGLACATGIPLAAGDRRPA